MKWGAKMFEERGRGGGEKTIRNIHYIEEDKERVLF